MKILPIFATFVLLHLIAWGVAHSYMLKHQEKILLVVDTSYAMKPKFTAMEQWIDQFAASSRYKSIVVGTDKALLGKLDDLKSRGVIFRTSFGHLSTDSLARYDNSEASRKILLSDGSLQPDGWKLVKF